MCLPLVDLICFEGLPSLPAMPSAKNSQISRVYSRGSSNLWFNSHSNITAHTRPWGVSEIRGKLQELCFSHSLPTQRTTATPGGTLGPRPSSSQHSSRTTPPCQRTAASLATSAMLRHMLRHVFVPPSSAAAHAGAGMQVLRQLSEWASVDIGSVSQARPAIIRNLGAEMKGLHAWH